MDGLRRTKKEDEDDIGAPDGNGKVWVLTQKRALSLFLKNLLFLRDASGANADFFFMYSPPAAQSKSIQFENESPAVVV